MNRYYTTLIILFAPTLLLAHGVHGDGIVAGICHPILGIDHNVALLSTTILGYLYSKKRWYIAPIAFIIGMVVTGPFGIGNEATASIETIISATVLINGILIISKPLQPSFMLPLLMLIFGGVHGYAHGAEMPENNTALVYISGYAIGAAALAVTGWVIASINTMNPTENRKLIGGIVIGSGLMMLLP